MSAPRSDFASFVGVTGAGVDALARSPGWRACVQQASSRVGTAPTHVNLPRVAAAYRGGARNFHRDATWMVFVDGTVDNLRALAEADATHSGPPGETDAALVARLFEKHDVALLPRLEGSFSLAVGRLDTGEITLVRDRYGSRPLFYGRCAAGEAWASEIKSLRPLVEEPELDPEGLRQAIHYRFVIGETLLKGVSQVLPASYVRLAPGREPVESRYWRLAFEPKDPGDGLDAWADRVDSALDAYMARLRSNHSRVGVLLSGGVDSSLLALKANRAGIAHCVALTARWPGENPELDLAVAIAKHIGIEHHVVDVDEARFERLFPWIVWRLEELPRHYNSLVLASLFEHASRHVDTILHGHSADVMFGPPDAVAIATFNRRRRLLSVIPRPVRRWAASWLSYDRGRRSGRLRQYLELDEHGYLKSEFAIEYGRARAPIKDLHFRPRGPSRRALEQFYDELDPAVERMQRLDTYTFNQSHFAVLDRLSAPHGLPVATPFLSPELMSVARFLPSQLKSTGRLTKPVLKRLMARSFPHEWVYRKKQGFPTHTTRWLNQPLARWRQLLAEERTRARGLLSLRSKRTADVGPDYEAIWSSISLEVFCRQFLDGDGGPDEPVS